MGYFRADNRVIRALSKKIVRKYFPNAKRISRKKALRHEKKGGAILMVG